MCDASLLCKVKYTLAAILVGPNSENMVALYWFLLSNIVQGSTTDYTNTISSYEANQS